MWEGNRHAGTGVDDNGRNKMRSIEFREDESRDCHLGGSQGTLVTYGQNGRAIGRNFSRLGSLSWPDGGDSIESDNTTRTAPVLQIDPPRLLKGPKVGDRCRLYRILAPVGTRLYRNSGKDFSPD